MLYSQTTGSGNKHIIFLHGNSSSHETWDNVINTDALNGYTVVTLDLPGHGKSDRSLNPETEYTLKGMGALIYEFISKFQYSEYIIVACSIATNFVSEIMPNLINCKGLFLTGACVIGKGLTTSDILQPNPNLAASFISYPTDEELNAFIDDIAYCISEEMKQKYRDSFWSTDPLFRSTLGKAIATEEWGDEIGNLENKNIDIPVAIVYGEMEKINNVNYLNKSTIKKWMDEIILIKDAGHFAYLDQPSVVADLIKNFAIDCFQKQAILY
ncbi:alpha/beta fold hydrolase [Mucilaginibacter flavus]|uniref:alpha/beta fold hydrolase n=1 Tax=Mucilaginibacter flavus TaxID=931504 RepID=UPI0025B40A81|nr:alpha/beta fold hydrolase [Mucilaginibacter flavus]MDN3584261.1 alpha/beta fold hydrolase [Mucilaginibacter flavus]